MGTRRRRTRTRRTRTKSKNKKNRISYLDRTSKRSEINRRSSVVLLQESLDELK